MKQLYSPLCLTFLLFIIIVSVGSQRCGYESCPKPKPNVVNIHLVAHTHDDVGWLKTKDQYYYGNRMNIQEAGVQYILDSVIDALVENPERRFIYVETAFFWMWWVEQTPRKKQIVQELVNSGRLEIIGGAWSMNDEAAAHYHSIIDQFTWGFRRLNESLGECATPKIGWQIDPFGHSRENAAIMAKMGFDGLFLGRIDYQDKVTRRFSKTLEMMWHTSENDMSDASKLFTCVMYNTYSPPPGFCFDVHCQDAPIVDNVKSPDYNVPERVKTFLSLMAEYKIPYRSNNILVTMGNDFNYQYAGMNFKNMDKLIRYINEYENYGSKFHAFYSTPSCYLKAVNEAGIHLGVKSDDFFPYASDPQSFWTGYFTSRPTHKRFERMGNNFLQVGKQILTISNLPYSVDISEAKEVMGVLQHHDAITGTEKAEVASDYARLLTNAMKTVENSASDGLNKLVTKGMMNRWMTSKMPEFTTCLLLNISSCPLTEKLQSYVVTVYNPLSRPVNKLVRIPVGFTNLNYKVRVSTGDEIPVQVVPLPEALSALPGREGNATVEIVFIATNLPPIGFRSYYIETSAYKQKNCYRSHLVSANEHKELLKLGYDNGAFLSLSTTGEIKTIRKPNAPEIPFLQNFQYYRGAVGNNLVPTGERSSGAYIFRPNGTVVLIDNIPTTRIYKGPVVTEIQQKFNDWISQVIRLYNGSDYVEFQWTVGPIPFKDHLGENFGKEVVSTYTMPKLHNSGIFYTDSNGREMIKRKLNYRPTWKVELLEKIAGNYYPVTTRISIKDNNNPQQILSVVTDRSQGGSSLKDGQIEVMLHRRLMHDDAFGVGEALNEEAFGKPLVASGSHYIYWGNEANAKLLVQEKVLDSWIFISPTMDTTFEKWSAGYLMEFSGLNTELPKNVQILTLERWMDELNENKIYLLRLENIMGKNENSTVAKINIKNLFSTFTVKNIKEMMLGGNIPVEKSTRLQWKSNVHERASKSRRSIDKPQDYHNGLITLKPMEIRTFLIEIEPTEVHNEGLSYEREAILLEK